MHPGPASSRRRSRGAPLDGYYTATSECWSVYGEVLGVLDVALAETREEHATRVLEWAQQMGSAWRSRHP